MDEPSERPHLYIDMRPDPSRDAAADQKWQAFIEAGSIRTSKCENCGTYVGQILFGTKPDEWNERNGRGWISHTAESCRKARHKLWDTP